MKHLLHIVLIFGYYNFYAQNYSVKYQAFPPKIEKTDNNLVNKVYQDQKELFFYLDFSSQQSKFYRKNDLKLSDLDNAFFELNLLLVHYKEVYTNINSPKMFIADKGYILTEHKAEEEWTLTEESKTVEGYLLYKATKAITYTTRADQERTRTVTAWYCPSIPFPYGPNGHFGLPGLIFEVQDLDVLYALKTITKVDNVEIVVPNKEKVTIEEYINKFKN
jgi:GLPGLI family protein